jgi:uncharacterized protein
MKLLDAADNSRDLTPNTLHRLTEEVRRRYTAFTSGLPFHGWHHVEFVRVQAVAYARKNGANVRIVEAAALLHDLNYMVKRNSRARAGKNLRHQILSGLGVSERSIRWIETVICEAETEARDENVSLEAQSLSDADTMFKALPITPVLLAPLYMGETGQSLVQLCDRIIKHQVPLYEQGIYFYNDEARKRYDEWAEVNLRLWQCIHDSLDHPEIRNLVASIEGEANRRAWFEAPATAPESRGR